MESGPTMAPRPDQQKPYGTMDSGEKLPGPLKIPADHFSAKNGNSSHLQQAGIIGVIENAALPILPFLERGLKNENVKSKSIHR